MIIKNNDAVNKAVKEVIDMPGIVMNKLSYADYYPLIELKNLNCKGNMK